MATVYSKDGAKSFSHNGISYKANEHGHFDVPDEALIDISAHGVAPVSEQAHAAGEGEGDAMDKLHKPTDLTKMNKTQIAAYAATIGLTLDPEMLKADMLAQIEAHAAGEGETVAGEGETVAGEAA